MGWVNETIQTNRIRKASGVLVAREINSMITVSLLSIGNENVMKAFDNPLGLSFQILSKDIAKSPYLDLCVTKTLFSYAKRDI